MPARRLTEALEASKKTDLNGLDIKLTYSCTFSENSVYSLQFNSVGSLALGLADGTIQFRDSDHKQISTTKAIDGDIPVMSVKWIKKDGILATLASGSIIECSINTGDPQIRRLFKEPSGTNCLDISPNNQATTGGSDGCLRIYDLSSETMVRDCSWHTSRIFSVKWKDYSVLVSGGWDNVIKLWDTRTRGTSVVNISGPHICGDAIDTFDNFLLTGSWRKHSALELWDCRFSSHPAVIFNLDSPEKGEYLYCASLLAQANSALAAGSGTCGLHLVNLITGKITAFVSFSRAVQTMHVNNEEAAMAGCGSNIRVCSLLR
ncbi:DgyrCDS3475 [Dimorphilus gyrociliatus]|uniref:DgyrCDS3475 n=1 Tax=Dimorphilus gyrociliatus TaxID=2664684 RepID=A0A7I8VIF0_9ANNE|nr:DgyrCDS3475 [Dimorphilus gyrociliatus]